MKYPFCPQHLFVNHKIPSPLLHIYPFPISILPTSQFPQFLHFSLTFPAFSPALYSFRELALPHEILEDSRNKRVVTALYDALNSRNAEAIQQILAADLEWWFHGPPSHQFLMHLLTGDHESDFRFDPQSISAFGPTVLAEGFDRSRSITWVHAWTVTDGIITGVREYFNTSLTVTRIGRTDQSDCTASIVSLNCPSVWESSLPDQGGKSVPGLVLAI